VDEEWWAYELKTLFFEQFKADFLIPSRHVKTMIRINSNRCVFNYRSIVKQVQLRFIQTVDHVVSVTPHDSSQLIDAYDSLYPWKNVSEFAQNLFDRIVYNDGRLIALDKPWGIGTYLTNSRTTKDTQYIMSQVPGRPKYCINDALPELCSKLKLPELHVLRSLDRQTSGLMLLGNDLKLKDNLKQSTNISKLTSKPPLAFECITSGYPINQHIKEKVAIVMETVDKGKQAVIRPISAAHRGAEAYKVQVEMKVIADNKSLAVSHVQLDVNSIRWHFPRIYAASICSFVLGKS
jgi:23S rRNA-/tRNA-specific pseudouridylate synthase